MNNISEINENWKSTRKLSSKPNCLTIYTDGACEPNPGCGGYGVVVLSKSQRTELSGGYRLTTNNRMEVMAAIVGLEDIKEPCIVTLYSDSQYLVNAMTRGWVYSWKSNNWRTRRGIRVNSDLWKRLLLICERHHEVEFVWVRGHSGNPENEQADFLACEALRSKRLLIDEEYEKSVA